jgi:4-hydroxybenzoate polyprenyltransferase
MKNKKNDRLEIIYKQSILKSPYTERSFLYRWWIFQLERIPIIVLFVLIFAIMFAIARSNGQILWSNLLIATFVGVLYLLQIRLSDEPKDFEHDNVYYPDRPVQRGLITLTELKHTNTLVVLLFFSLAVSTRSWMIFTLACIQQSYAFLTRNEFFLRDWLRAHFLTYQFLHYIQLFILDWLTLSILDIQPVHKKLGYFVFVLLLIAMAESTRTIGNKDNQNAHDRYSNRLGTTTALLVFLSLAGVSALYTIFLTQSFHDRNIWFLLALAIAIILFLAHQYWRKPTQRNEQLLQLGALVLLLSAAITLALSPLAYAR